MKKLVLIALLLLSMGQDAAAQFNVDIQGAYLSVFSKDNPGHLGAGVTGEYSAAPTYAFYLGYSYYFSQPYNGFAIAEAKSSSTVPQKQAMDVIYDVTLHQFYIGGKWYFSGEQYSFKKVRPWGGFLVGEIGAMFGAMEITTDDNAVSAVEYEIPVKDGMLEAYTDGTLNFGIGADKQFMNSVYFYCKGMANLRIFNANTTGHDFKMPIWLTLNLGLRFMWGDEL